MVVIDQWELPVVHSRSAPGINDQCPAISMVSSDASVAVFAMRWMDRDRPEYASKLRRRVSLALLDGYLHSLMLTAVHVRDIAFSRCRWGREVWA